MAAQRTFRLSDAAIADVDNARRWLTQPGSGKNARRLHALRRAIKRLKLHPCLYAQGDAVGTREASIAGGYRIVYRVDPDTGDNRTAGDVVVLRVFGPGRHRGPP